MAGRLALEARTVVDHIDGRAENVAEHNFMLSKIAVVIATKLYPELDAGKVALLTNVHDDVEAYVGDTPTHELTDEITLNKNKLEKLGLAILLEDYAHIPFYLDLVTEYEAQETPEARFVRILDKLMPIVVHYNQDGETLRNYWTVEEFETHNERKEQKLLADYPEFEELISIRKELNKLAGKVLFKKSDERRT